MSEAEQTAPQEIEKDYQRAARLIREKFAALGISATFTAPAGNVGKAPKATPDNPRPQGWAHVVFGVYFHRMAVTGRGFSSEYRIGTGLAPWKHPKVKSAARLSWGPFGHAENGAALYVAERECLGKGRSRYRPEIEAEAAMIACKVANWTPDPAEVFASVCRDGFEARDVTFEDWAECFGYDPDSREGERVFNACRTCWANALHVVSAADAEEFAVLAGEL